MNIPRKKTRRESQNLCKPMHLLQSISVPYVPSRTVFPVCLTSMYSTCGVCSPLVIYLLLLIECIPYRTHTDNEKTSSKKGRVKFTETQSIQYSSRYSKVSAERTRSQLRTPAWNSFSCFLLGCARKICCVPCF